MVQNICDRMFTISNSVEIRDIILSSYIVLEGLSYKYVIQICR